VIENQKNVKTVTENQINSRTVMEIHKKKKKRKNQENLGN
jgi:hypothetical protein